MEKILRVDGLTKSFNGKQVLNDVSFHVQRGEVLCVLGPNGAGKTTAINILTAALDKDGGEIYFKEKLIGEQLPAYKGALGIVPQNVALYEELSGERNLAFFAALYGLRGKQLQEAVDFALEFAGLQDRRKDKVKTYSGGMKRRLNVACAVAHRPELVIMDEPTVGIDPQSRNHILESIGCLQRDGMTIVYTTHYMEEVEAISTRILIMDHGRIIAEGTSAGLKEEVAREKRYMIEIESHKEIEARTFFAIEGVTGAKLQDNVLGITSLRGVENLDRIIALLIDCGVKIKNITGEEASLETVFLRLTGRKLRD